MSKLNQRDVNKIHRLHRAGLDGHTIAKSFNVAGCTIHYVLNNRPPTTGPHPFKCDRCDKGVGANRVRTVKKALGAGGYNFCPPCHGWVFDTRNFRQASAQFKGIF